MGTLARTRPVLVSSSLALLAPIAVAATFFASADHAARENPESIVFDRLDNAYVSLAMTGEIRKISPDFQQSSLAFLPIEGPCAPKHAVALGLTLDQGLWRVDRQSGALEQVARAPSATVLNGIDVHGDWIYAADTFDGRIWRAPVAGGELEIWADDPLLKRPEGAVYPGPNGLRYFRGEIFVAVSTRGTVVAIPVRPGGGAGRARVHATLPPEQGCDEFAFDVLGSIYCTTDPFNTVVRLDPDGTTEILLTEADGLDGPTSAAFGRRGRNRKNLYVTNAAFPIFTTTFRPSLMRLPLDVPGAP
jgi:sugar lactone lactonase YvrE